mgnify:CR=1 FL=1
MRHVAAAFTPGPNNIIGSYSGFNFGIKKSIPLILGVTFGYTTLITLSAGGLNVIFSAYPILKTIIKILGSFFLIYLAYKISFQTQVEKKKIKNPVKFYETFIFQFVNPKAWVICITAVSLFYPQKEHIGLSIFFMVFMATIINLPSISMWAIGGSVIRQYLRNEAIKKIIEWLLAILLIGTSISILL